MEGETAYIDFDRVCEAQRHAAHPMKQLCVFPVEHLADFKGSLYLQSFIAEIYMVESCVVARLCNWRCCDIATEIMERALKQ